MYVMLLFLPQVCIIGTYWAYYLIFVPSFLYMLVPEYMFMQVSPEAIVYQII